MFDVKAKKDLLIERFDIHAKGEDTSTIYVYTKSGSYSGSEFVSVDWTHIHTEAYTSQGKNNKTALSVFTSPVEIKSGEIQSFYVRSDSAVWYTTCGPYGYLVVDNGDLQFFEGVGVKGASATFCDRAECLYNRIWNGVIDYKLV